MKKTLVYAMAMAMGISATAFAANPFSDLPAGHWAYGAVAKLAAAGVVDGYPDGTFKGDRTMTRYEMAQIVAKALAKGAIGADDKLVSEFADELDNLGVRVAKLEKNADNVKITGNVRLSYDHSSGGAVNKWQAAKAGRDNDDARLRTRLFLTGEVNDNWHYVSMLENNQHFIGQNESGDDDTDFQRAYLTGNIGVVNLTGGRFQDFIADGNIYDSRVDAIKANVKIGQAYITGVWGKMANKSEYSWSDSNNDSVADKYWRAEVGGRWGNLNMAANYVRADDVTAMGMGGDDDSIWTVGADYTAGKFNFGAMYLNGDNDHLDDMNKDDDGVVAWLKYGGATASKPGSWGLYTKYYDQAATTTIAHTMNGRYDVFPEEGFKGWQFGGNVALAKNMVAQVEYFDLKGKDSDEHARTLWSQMVVTF